MADKFKIVLDNTVYDALLVGITSESELEYTLLVQVRKTPIVFIRCTEADLIFWKKEYRKYILKNFLTILWKKVQKFFKKNTKKL